MPREQGQGAARENAALGAHPGRFPRPHWNGLLIWPLCEESNLANRVRSPMPGRRDRENRAAERAAARERHRAVRWTAQEMCERHRARSPPDRRSGACAARTSGAAVVTQRWQAGPPRRGLPKKTTGQQISPVSPAGFEPAFPE